MEDGCVDKFGVISKEDNENLCHPVDLKNVGIFEGEKL